MHWNFTPEVFSGLPVRWYGVVFALGLYIAASWLPKNFQLFGIDPKHADRVVWVLPLCMLVGAHWVHFFFYEPQPESLRLYPEQLYNPLKYGAGLASHGGGLGAIFGTYLLSRKHGGAHKWLDPVLLSAVWVFPFVRIGNFLNSEILGDVTTMPWGVYFDNAGPPLSLQPRHPVQLYEAGMNIVLIGISLWIRKNYAGKLRPGAIFYTLLGTYFTFRFFAEFFKDHQEIDQGWALNMGQYLSIPIILVCAFMALVWPKTRVWGPYTPEPVSAPVPAQPLKKTSAEKKKR